MLKTSLGIAATVAVVSMVWTSDVDGVEFFTHRGRRCNKGAIEAFGYRPYDKVEANRVIAIASADQPVAVSQYVPEAGRPGERAKIELQRKLFPINVNAIAAGGVSLERMGATFYSDGGYACTGLLSFDGGPDKALHGANVAIRLRAYSATPQQEGGLLNARLLWDTNHELFVRRDQSLACSLIPDLDKSVRAPAPRITITADNRWPHHPSDLILRHFDEITHLEIILERYTDR